MSEDAPSSPGGASRRRTARAVVRSLPPGRYVLRKRALSREVEQLRRRNTRLQEDIRALRAELRETRGAERRVRRLGDREDLNFLFIVTYGRSGSTLLQGIISSIPGYLVRGENAGIAYHLYKFHATAAKRSTSKRARWKSPQSAWYGIGEYPQELALRELRRLLLMTVIRPASDSRVVGFKEIRWLYDDLHEYVDFLRAVFPGARFVVNTRNLDDVIVSKWWAKNEGSRRVLEEAESRMVQLTDRLGDDAYHIHYDDYVQSPGKLRGLFEWLGEEFDEDHVATVMAKQHSY
jgi:Sulfotransferase family